MPKLPVLKDKQLVKALLKMGFFIHRQKGTSHLIMAHSDGRRTTVPIHPGNDIPKGTLKAILNDLKINIEEFTNTLRQ